MSTESESWVRAALAGERAAARELQRRLRPVIERCVQRALRRLHRPRASAADLVQDAWVFLLEDGGQRLLAHDSARGVALETYVAVLVRRRMINCLEHQGAKKRGLDAQHCPFDDTAFAASSDPEQAVLCVDLIAAIFARIAAELPRSALNILEAVYFRGMAPADAAIALGLNTQVVRNWQMHIRRVARAVGE